MNLHAMEVQSAILIDALTSVTTRQGHSSVTRVLPIVVELDQPKVYLPSNKHGSGIWLYEQAFVSTSMIVSGRVSDLSDKGTRHGPEPGAQSRETRFYCLQPLHPAPFRHRIGLRPLRRLTPVRS